MNISLGNWFRFWIYRREIMLFISPVAQLCIVWHPAQFEDGLHRRGAHLGLWRRRGVELWGDAWRWNWQWRCRS